MKLRNNYRVPSSLYRARTIQLLAITLVALIALSTQAFNATLQPEEIEEAYSLGQTTNHEELSEFLHQYEHDFKYSSDNPIAFVQSVEFQTPYEQIVLRSLHTTQYTKFQAAEDYQANPGLVIVRVVVSLKTGYSGPEPAADSFQVGVSEAKAIQPREASGKVLCNPFNWNENSTAGNCVAYTREIVMRFNAAQFAPGRASVKVTLPFGPPVETKYNLDKLK